MPKTPTPKPRKEPLATDKQMEILNKLGLDCELPLTAKEAENFIRDVDQSLNRSLMKGAPRSAKVGMEMQPIEMRDGKLVKSINVGCITFNAEIVPVLSQTESVRLQLKQRKARRGR